MILLWLSGLIGVASPAALAEVSTYTLAQIETNVGNRLNLPPGDQHQSTVLGAAIKAETRPQLLSRLGAKSLTRLEAGIALYYLGLSYGKGPGANFATVIRYYKVSADVYLDPISILVMSRVYFHGFEDGGKVIVPKSLDRSFEYLNRGWEIGNVLRVNGIDDLWPVMVDNYLPLGDSFYGFNAQKTYPTFQKLEALRPSLMALRKQVADDYHLKLPDDPHLVYESHY